MANTTSRFHTWNGSSMYEKFDIAWGANSDDLTYYYSTQDNNAGYSPLAVYAFSVTSYSRNREIATVHYTTTGSPPPFAPGSLVRINGVSNGTFAHTGMIANAGNGFIQYVSAGPNVATTIDGGSPTLQAIMSPAWTTGFMFAPSYASNLESQQSVIVAQFEAGYAQRQPASINSNTDQWNLVFNDRSDKEARAIYHFVQDKAGVYPFSLMLPVGSLVNNPNQKFIGNGTRISTKSYNLNDVSVAAREVFDI